MAAVTIRRLPEETMAALRARAKQNGRSVESEIRLILQHSTHPPERIKLGSALAEIGRRYGGIDIQFERDGSPFEGADFS